MPPKNVHRPDMNNSKIQSTVIYWNVLSLSVLIATIWEQN